MKIKLARFKHSVHMGRNIDDKAITTDDGRVAITFENGLVCVKTRKEIHQGGSTEVDVRYIPLSNVLWMQAEEESVAKTTKKETKE